MNKDKHIIIEIISEPVSAELLFPYNVRRLFTCAVVCACCGRHMRGYRRAEIVSHGICQDCAKKTTTDIPKI